MSQIVEYAGIGFDTKTLEFRELCLTVDGKEYSIDFSNPDEIKIYDGELRNKRYPIVFEE